MIKKIRTYHALAVIKMGKDLKINKTQCWQECGESGISINCLEVTLWIRKAVCQVWWGSETSSDHIVQLLGVYPELGKRYICA